jgi:hypothetical protein
MFCSYCGEKIAKDQKFCHNCGAEVVTSSKAPDHQIERVPQVTVPKIIYVPVKEQKQMGIPGTYSKWCLGLALSSFIIGIGSLIFGYNYFRILYWSSHSILGMLTVATMILLFRIAGLIMGIFAKVNSSKAEIFEPYNDVEKAGSIIGVLGIIVNSIGLFLSLLGPLSIFSFRY